jgi:hypothetical protein
MSATVTPAVDVRARDAKLRSIAGRAAKIVELIVDKAIANHEEPTRYPLPAGAALERTLRASFDKLPRGRQKDVAAAVMPRVKAAAAARQQRYGDLAAVDLRQSSPILAQAAKHELPAALRMSSAEARSFAAAARLQRAGAAPRRVELRMHRMEAVEKTREFLELKDEIKLVAAPLDVSADGNDARTFDLGQFKNHEVKTFSPPTTIATFSLTDNSQPASTFAATLALIEEDRGTFPEALNLILQAVKSVVTQLLTEAITGDSGANDDGGAAGETGANGETPGASAPISNKDAIVTLIVLALPLVVDKALSLIKAWYEDEIFNEEIVSVEIPSLSAPFPGGKTDSAESAVGFVRVKGKGVYKMTFDWRVV